MCNNSIGSGGATALAAALPSLTSLLELNLSNNIIGDAGCSALAAALPSLTALTVLDLSANYNSFGPAGEAAVRAAIPPGCELYL